MPYVGASCELHSNEGCEETIPSFLSIRFIMYFSKTVYCVRLMSAHV